MESLKEKLGSPFDHGSLSNVVLAGALTSCLVYWDLADGEEVWLMKGLVFVGAAMTFKAYWRYRKIRHQRGVELIGDREE